MFERIFGLHPFLGPSERPMASAPKPTFNHPVARGTVKNEGLAVPGVMGVEPKTPQPVANKASHPMSCNVAPPGYEGTVKALKKESGVDNPFALAWWMKDQGYKSHK